VRGASYWRHTCVTCGAEFFGSRCRIACDSCRAAGADRARGRCLLCETRVPFHPDAHVANKGFLFCKECLHERTLETIRRAKRLRHLSQDRAMERALAPLIIVPTPKDEEVEP